MTPPNSQTAPPMSQVANEYVPKIIAFMKGLGLIENKDFTVGTTGRGDKHSINVKLNTGYEVKHYRPSVQQQLKDTGLALNMENDSLHVRERKGP